jgi:hypothetical protein
LVRPVFIAPSAAKPCVYANACVRQQNDQSRAKRKKAYITGCIYCKGMLDRGDRHHDIAAWFGVNQGP